MDFNVEDQPDPRDIEFLETQIRREASATMELGDELDLAIFVRDADRVVAGISGWTWGDCCELQSLWVEPSLRGRGLATRRSRRGLPIGDRRPLVPQTPEEPRGLALTTCARRSETRPTRCTRSSRYTGR